MATRAKYTRVDVPEQKNQTKLDTDILMRFCQSYGRYVSRSLTLFFGEGKNFVTIKAAERLMDRALWVAEVVRRKVQGLHQIVHVTEKKIVDVYQPTEEGLLTVRQERFLTVIEVTLTKQPTAEQKKHPGYHAPLTIKSDFLTKQSWERGEKERAENKLNNGDRKDQQPRGERRERRQNKEGNGSYRPRREGGQDNQNGTYRPRREDRQDKRENNGYRAREDNRQNRGGETRRGGRRND